MLQHVEKYLHMDYGRMCIVQHTLQLHVCRLVSLTIRLTTVCAVQTHRDCNKEMSATGNRPAARLFQRRVWH